MSITLHISQSAEEAIRRAFGADLDTAGHDALVIEAYRTGRLSIGQVARVLGVATVFEAEAWLGAHGVNWNYGAEDLAADRATLDELFGESSK